MDTDTDNRHRLGLINGIGALILIAWLLVLSSCEALPDFYYDFEVDADLDRIGWKCKTVFSLSDEHVTSGKKSLLAEFYNAGDDTDNQYPGVALKGFNSDWRKHNILSVDIFNPASRPLSLAIRIDDRDDSPPYGDRFNTSIKLAPGANNVTIPLRELITSKSKRRLDLGNIEGVYLFLVNPTENYSLYFDNIHLE